MFPTQSAIDRIRKKARNKKRIRRRHFRWGTNTWTTVLHPAIGKLNLSGQPKDEYRRERQATKKRVRAARRISKADLKERQRRYAASMR